MKMFDRTAKIFWLLALLATGPAFSRAAFTGPYQPANWTLTNTNADGTVDLSLAPAQILLVGGDNHSLLAGVTEWKVAITNAATLQFNWSYFTRDDLSGPWDRAGWRLNTNSVELARNNSTNLAGQVSINVNPGDEFAFWVRTEDNMVAPGELTITNFLFEAAVAAAPRFLCSMAEGTNVTFQFESTPGRTYRMEAVTELPSTNWLQVGTNIPAVSNITTVTTATLGTTNRFFRAVLLP
jgi:hypothetical protein